MTNSQFKNIFESFARKMPFGHNPEEYINRFCQYEIDEYNYLPDLSQYQIDLNEFCLCVSHLDINISAKEADQHKRMYQTNVLIIKACSPGDYTAQAETVDAAQQRAEWLWASLLHYQKCEETVDKDKGWFFERLKLDGNFKMNDITNLANGACGVEMTLSFSESITHQNIMKKYPNWN